MRRTPTQVLGPFYPVVKPLEQDADLTVKPGAYPEDSGAMRAPHIHFEVLGRTNRLVTQMYFAGEPLNDTDRFLATAAGNRERLIVPFRPSPEPQADGLLVGVWDIVLDQG